MFSDRFEREQVFLLFESALKLPDGTKIDDPITECLRRVDVLAVWLECHGPKGKNSTYDELLELAGLLDEASEASKLRDHWPRIYDLLREFEPAWQLIETQHRLSVRPRPGIYKDMLDRIESTDLSQSTSDIKSFLSENGKKGAKAREEPRAKLRQWVIEEYLKGAYPSSNSAAHALTASALEKSRAMGVALSKENAQRTIAEWIRGWKKEANQPSN